MERELSRPGSIGFQETEHQKIYTAELYGRRAAQDRPFEDRPFGSASAPQHIIRLRLTNDAQIVARGRLSVASLLRARGVPEEPMFDIDLVLGEALSNILKHDELARSARLCAAVLPEQVVMTLVYESLLFDTTRPDPGPLAENGRGIPIIRGFCEMGGGKAEYRFHRLRRGPYGDVYRVSLVMVKRWK